LGNIERCAAAALFRGCAGILGGDWRGVAKSCAGPMTPTRQSRLAVDVMLSFNYDNTALTHRQFFAVDVKMINAVNDSVPRWKRIGRRLVTSARHGSLRSIHDLASFQWIRLFIR
jgi:hypothetical protein